MDTPKNMVGWWEEAGELEFTAAETTSLGLFLSPRPELLRHFVSPHTFTNGKDGSFRTVHDHYNSQTELEEPRPFKVFGQSWAFGPTGTCREKIGQKLPL